MILKICLHFVFCRLICQLPLSLFFDYQWPFIGMSIFFCSPDDWHSLQTLTGQQSNCQEVSHNLSCILMNKRFFNSFVFCQLF